MAGAIAAFAAVAAAAITAGLAYWSGRRLITAQEQHSRTERFATAKGVVLGEVRSALGEYVTAWTHRLSSVGVLIQTGSTAHTLGTLTESNEALLNAQLALDIKLNQLDDAELQQRIIDVAGITSEATQEIIHIVQSSQRLVPDELRDWYEKASHATLELRKEVVSVNAEILEHLADAQPRIE